jgi:OOP family OmpA-OmpF porin
VRRRTTTLATTQLRITNLEPLAVSVGEVRREIELWRHTDADGEDGFNQALSEKRAQAVTEFLVKAGLPAERFTAMGYGSTQPVATNDTDEGKAQNRRIDFVVR